MDLRYLEFLLSAYSWSVVIFCLIMTLWLVSNNLSEIDIAGIKMRLAISARSLGSLVVIVFVFSAIISGVVYEINVEIKEQEGSVQM